MHAAEINASSPFKEQTEDSCRGLVVGGCDYGEADRIIQVLTANGCMRVFAHGARKSRRRFAGALDPFTTVDMALERKRRSGMRTVRSAVVFSSRLAIRDQLEKIALASYIAELGAAVAPEGDPMPGLYETVESTLDLLLDHEPSPMLRRRFELKTIEILGYAPRIDSCVDCGGDLPEIAHLDFARGGLFCAEHAEQAPRIGPKTLAWMAAVYGMGLGEQTFDSEWAATAAQKLGGPVGAFFSHLLGYALKSTKLLQVVSL
jgi:DNA repair protein RecO (recombination protein O)